MEGFLFWCQEYQFDTCKFLLTKRIFIVCKEQAVPSKLPLILNNGKAETTEDARRVSTAKLSLGQS